MANTIRHQGIVENIEGSHLQVRIVQTSACATCSIKGHCTSADTKEKLIDIVESESHTYRQGDKVWVLGELSMGMQAVLLAFVIPLILIVVTLFVGMALFADELRAVLCVPLSDCLLFCIVVLQGSIETQVLVFYLSTGVRNK